MEAGRPELWSPAEGLDGAEGWPERRAEILERWERWVSGPPPADGPRPSTALHVPSGPPRGFLVTFSPWREAALAWGWAVCQVAVDGQNLAWRARALSRALDSVRENFGDLPAVVAGHGPGAKAALLAGAYDERFAGVICSSGGPLAAVPVRRFCERHFGEGIEPLTRRHPGWFQPGLRHFSGREHLLPTDAHELLALIAPRRLLVCTHINDPGESAVAVEEAVAAARDVYARLGVPEALHLQWRDDGRDLPAMLAWMEGAEPASGRAPVAASTELRLPDDVRCRPERALDGLEFEVLEAVDGQPRGRVVWLPPLCPPTGYIGAYEDGEPLPVLLARAGWQVACHEAAGTGSRISEVGSFGRRIADALSVLDAEPQPSWLVAYGDGCEIALHLAREHPAVAGGIYVAPGPAARLLAPGPPALVFAPEIDPTTGPGEVLAACRAAGAECVSLEDWHRLSADTRELVVQALVQRGVKRHGGEEGVLAPHAPEHG
jgi:hypothetical protein